jgi:hypothetical protein
MAHATRAPPGATPAAGVVRDVSDTESAITLFISDLG